MKLKLLKFHAIMHMTEDIYNFGVPSNYDTGPMEAGHKPVKVASKRHCMGSFVFAVKI